MYALERTERPHQWLSGSGDGHVVRWDLRDPGRGELVADAVHGVYSLHLQPQRQRLYIGNANGGLHVIDLKEREELRLLQAHRKGIFTMLPLPEDRLLCTGGDGVVTVWEMGTMELLRSVPLCEEKVRGAAMSPDGQWIAMACGDGTVRVLDAESLNEHGTIEAHAKGAASVCWHPAKPLLLTGGRDGHIRVWRADKDYEQLIAVPAHRANIYSIAFDPSARMIATASRDKSIKLWNAADLEPIARMDLGTRGHTHSVNVACWCEDGTLISASDDRRIMHWKAGSAPVA